MKKQAIVTQTVRVNEYPLDDFYEELSRRWQEKARRLQARRWRKIHRRSKHTY